MPEEWAAAAARAVSGKSSAATPLPNSPKKAPKRQGSVPVSSTNTPPSSLPPIKKQPSTPGTTPALRTTWGKPKPRSPLPEKFEFGTRKKFFEEKLLKDRLVKRDFDHIRHEPYYKDLTRPERESPSFADYHRKEFWRTDVERVIKQDEDKRRARQKVLCTLHELLGIWTNEEAWRRHRAAKLREIKNNAYIDNLERMKKVGCRANLSGAPLINIITRHPIGVEIPDEPPTYHEDVSKYKAIQRKLLLREKMSGARNFNILSWNENPPGPALPPWPEKPPTPPPPPPPKPLPPSTNSSKGALSYGRLLGPFGVVDVN